MRLGKDSFHTVWDNSIAPVLRVAPGDTLDIEVADASGGQVRADSSTDVLADLDFDRLNPVTGPIAVDGAAPGDTLIIDVLDIRVAGRGWSANLPGFGLLAEEFTEPYLRISPVHEEFVEFERGLQVPVLPMIGTIGVAPDAAGVLPMIPPHRFGGNMDIRHVTAGTRLRLPVGVDGGNLSLGDTHAAMGDGEVCGTGVEVGAEVTVRLNLEKGATVPSAVLETDGRAARIGATVITTGIGPDIWTAARDAARSMIDQIVRRTGLEPVQAYLLVSVAADMHVSEIVDLPNVVVSMHLPRDIIEPRGGS